MLRRGDELLEITPEIMAFLNEPRPLIIAKANVHARVHRRVYLDYIGVKRFDAAGNLVGEFRIVGLFTSTAYTRAAHGIPYLRRKVAAVERRAGFDPGSHSGKALANVLENYPRDELFQIDEDTLYQFALAILQLDERPRVRVLARRDRFDRFVSVLVYRAARALRQRHPRARSATISPRVFKGRVSAFYPFFPEGPLVRVHFIIGRSGGATPSRSTARRWSARSRDIVRTWTDGLADALALAHRAGQGARAVRALSRAFSAGYREAYPPAVAVGDIRVIEGLTAERPLGVDFHHRLEEEQRSRRPQGLELRAPIPLSERVPVLENMGFRVVDERTYHIAAARAAPARLAPRHDAGARATAARSISTRGKARLEAAFLMVMRGQRRERRLQRAGARGGLGVARRRADPHDLALPAPDPRALFAGLHVGDAGASMPRIAAEIVALFHARFDPRARRRRATREAEARSPPRSSRARKGREPRRGPHPAPFRQRRCRRRCAPISIRLDDDGQPKAQIAIKFDSRKVDELPLPRPLYEIFVYSPRVEGVHLRFGKVARGGIRWSDRPQDFRTEVLGLVKAQQVKNAVIVPVGAKGGFVPKRMPGAPTREAVQAEGVATYKTLHLALLDITDNLGPDGKIVPPDNVVRHDDDDPYLVVAADKGTATFSDIANGISIEHGFWLGDAFASGGSAGYDHKGMGITARGAWESVKRHFREIDSEAPRAVMPIALWS